MFFNPTWNVFNFSVDNYGATYSDTALGTNCPGHANANTKGANTNLLNGLAEDCYGLSIMFLGGNTTTAIRRQFTDILIDPNAGVGNAGSAWSVLIANLYANSPCFGAAVGAYGYSYYFPIYMKAGTAIGAAHQDLVATTQALRVAVRAFGKPSRPEMTKYGSKVTTYGATVGTTTGVTVTPGTATIGSYTASLGALANDAWWFQLGIGSADTTMTANTYLFELAVGDATIKQTVLALPYIVLGTAEQASKSAIGGDSPVFFATAGQNLYVRAVGAAAPDTAMTCVAYAVEG